MSPDLRPGGEAGILHGIPGTPTVGSWEQQALSVASLPQLFRRNELHRLKKVVTKIQHLGSQLPRDRAGCVRTQTSSAVSLTPPHSAFSSQRHSALTQIPDASHLGMECRGQEVLRQRTRSACETWPSRVSGTRQAPSGLPRACEPGLRQGQLRPQGSPPVRGEWGWGGQVSVCGRMWARGTMGLSILSPPHAEPGHTLPGRLLPQHVHGPLCQGSPDCAHSPSSSSLASCFCHFIKLLQPKAQSSAGSVAHTCGDEPPKRPECTALARDPWHSGA